MSMTDDIEADYPPSTLAGARGWIDGLSDPSGLRGSWRLQVLEQRVSFRDGERVERPVRMVRFAKGCPLELMSAAERYLLSMAPYSGVIANGVVFPGSFRPTRTRWIRDDQTSVDDQRRSTNENRYTLVQDLVDATAPDGDSVPSSEDCVESVTTEYRWDEASLPDASELPSQAQGVTVSVQQVARQEDGTYRYAIVTRTAKTRVGAGAVVECTGFRTVTQQDFTNLYGDPETGFADGTGASVQVPAQCGGDAGTSVEWRNLRQNDDCTWNVSVVTTVAKPVPDAERTSSETSVERRDSRKDAAQQAPVEHVMAQDPNLSGDHGRVFEQRSEKRPDGLYDNTVSERDEKELANQVVEKRRTVRGVTSRRVNRNMKASAPDPAAGTVGTVVNTVTDSGRVTQEITSVDRNADPIDAGEGCSKTVFEHVTTERTVQPEKPTGHVADAANGVRFERTSRITEEGSFDVTVEKREELPKAKAQVTVRKTLRGTQKTVVDRNVATPLPETGLAVGETRQSEVTPGGLYNTTKTVTTAEAAGEIGTDCQQTVYEHTDSVTSNQASRPAAEAGAAGGGRTRRKTARQTEEGTWDVTTQTTEEKAQPGSTKSWRKTLRGTQQTIVDRNSTTAVDGTGLSVGETRTSELTPGGLYNNTRVTVTADVAGTVGDDCRQTVFEHVDSTTSNQADRPAGHAAAAGGGKTYQRTARQTEEGTWDVTTQTTEEKAQPGSTKSWRKTLRGSTVTTVDRNASSPLTGAGLNLGETQTSEMTPGGRYNNTKVEVSPDPVGTVATSCEKSDIRHVHSTTVNQRDRGPEEATASGNTVKRVSNRATEEGSWDVTTEETTHQTRTVTATTRFATEDAVTTTTVNSTSSSPSASQGTASGAVNEHGTFTTTVTEYTPKPKDSGWITWDSETRGPRSTYKYHNGVRVFKNLDTVPTPPRGKAGNVSISLNRYGKYDGTMSYSELYDWSEDGGSGSESGVSEGQMRIYYPKYQSGGSSFSDPIKTTTTYFTVDVVHFYGPGHNGSEASYIANARTFPGIVLPSRTYVRRTWDAEAGGDNSYARYVEDTEELANKRQRYYELLKAGT